MDTCRGSDGCFLKEPCVRVCMPACICVYFCMASDPLNDSTMTEISLKAPAETAHLQRFSFFLTLPLTLMTKWNMKPVFGDLLHDHPETHLYSHTHTSLTSETLADLQTLMSPLDKRSQDQGTHFIVSAKIWLLLAQRPGCQKTLLWYAMNHLRRKSFTSQSEEIYESCAQFECMHLRNHLSLCLMSHYIFAINFGESYIKHSQVLFFQTDDKDVWCVWILHVTACHL